MTESIPLDLPIRPAFWNVPLWGEVGVYIVGILAVILCAVGVAKNVRRWRAGRAATAARDPKRVERLMREAVAQEKIRETVPGKIHAVLVLGFFLLFLGTATATLDWDVGHYIFGSQFLKGDLYLFYKLVLDTAGVAVLVALALGAWRRWCTPSNLPRDRRFVWVYASLAFIVASGFVVEALRLAVQRPAWADFSPVGSVLADIFIGWGLSNASLESTHVLLWTVHGLAALAFVAAIPLTYYAHIYRTPVSIALPRGEARGVDEKIEAIEEQEHFGWSTAGDLPRSARIQADACTECGRCEAVCPAMRAGTPLAPRAFVMKLRELAAASPETALSERISTEELFACTTCGACARVCPADIEIPRLIVQMRRHLALECGEFPEGAAAALENTASVGNPWGLDPYERLDWAEGLDVPVAEEGASYDVLYWVGCAASYDRRARRIARSMVKILKRAGVSFAVMVEERCHGEFARRLGEEYLYQTAAQENIENFAKYRFKRILAACPHCFHTLKNEYPQFEGGKFEVVDHASFIRELIDAGRLPDMSDREARGGLTVYHDPCYLARLNGVASAPRTVLSESGQKLVEPRESGALSFCCGAGGGQMWCEGRSAKKPVNVIRLEALRATGATTIAAACPHCITMLESAKSTMKDADELRIEDIAEIVARSLPDEE